MRTNVAIVGGQPTGLMVSQLLRLAGIQREGHLHAGRFLSRGTGMFCVDFEAQRGRSAMVHGLTT